MCIFTTNTRVENTKIFARRQGQKQWLVYEMKYDSYRLSTAMILPVPGESETIEFLNLENYKDFFDQLQKPAEARGFSKGLSLDVVNVGNFIATIIPSMDDWNRVDPQFTLDSKVWESDILKEYTKGYSFVVFQLSERSNKPHPMAFTFNSNLDELYIPTVHVHDGEVKDLERYDHEIYTQGTINPPHREWILEDYRAKYLEYPGLIGDIVDLNSPIHYNPLKGLIINKDWNQELSF
jgi:hypothetical protein